MQDSNKDQRINAFLGLALGCLVALAGVLLWIYRSKPPTGGEVVQPIAASEPETAANPTPAVVPTPTAPASALEAKWGIQVSGLTLTNGDSAVDLRYTILAPEKTALLTGADAEVYIIDQASGKKLPMFTVAPASKALSTVPPRTTRRMMRQAGTFPPAPTRMVAGRTYSLLIPNWGQTIKSGALVTVVVGYSRMENLTVQ